MEGKHLSAKHAHDHFIDCEDTERVVCPNCGYELTYQEANAAFVDDFYIDALREDEPRTVTAICPSCSLDFGVTATLAVRFTTAKAGDANA